MISGVVPYEWGGNDLGGSYQANLANREFHVRMTHHSRIRVETGDSVTAGQHVADIGSTGQYTTGPHVHLEVRLGQYDDGLVIDPLHFFIAAIPGLREVIDAPS